MRHFTVFLLFLTIAFTAATQTIDSDQSVVNFTVSNMKVNTVAGTVSGMSGDIKFIETDIAASSFEVCVDVNTIDTKNEERDAHLKNPDFFDVEKYPTICFESTKIEKTGHTYKVSGNLTMHGVTKEVEIPFIYSDNTFGGNIIVNRYDYKVGMDTNTMMVGEEVNLVIVCKVK